MSVGCYQKLMEAFSRKLKHNVKLLKLLAWRVYRRENINYFDDVGVVKQTQYSQLA